MSYTHQNNLGAHIDTAGRGTSHAGVGLANNTSSTATLDPTYSKIHNEHNPLTSNVAHGSALGPNGHHNQTGSALKTGVDAVTGNHANGGHIGTTTGNRLNNTHASGTHGLTGSNNTNTHGLAGSNVHGTHGVTDPYDSNTHSLTGNHKFTSNELNGTHTTGASGVTGAHTSGTHGLTKTHTSGAHGTHGLTNTHTSEAYGVTSSHVGPKGEEVKPSKFGGKKDEIKGNMKESLGKTFNKPEMIASGIQDQHVGEARQAAAAAKKN